MVHWIPYALNFAALFCFQSLIKVFAAKMKKRAEEELL
jgi:hypothetical protein